FLFVAGNAGSETSKDQPVTEDYIEGRPSELMFWRPANGEISGHGVFPRVKKGKEEAILILSEGDHGSPAELLILYDSIENGGATTFATEISTDPGADVQ